MVTIRKLEPKVGTIKMPTIREMDPDLLVRRVAGFGSPTIIVRRRRDHPAPTPQPTPCVLWQGPVDRYGYGLRWVHEARGKRRKVKMHRWIMEQVLGRRLKPNQFVLHACDNRACYRVEHLSIGSVQDNNRDMKQKGRAKPPPRNPHLRGEKHPRAKITQRQVDHALKLYRQGFTQQSIAELMGISRSQVGRICRGVNWRASTKTLKEDHHEHPAEGPADAGQDADA